MNNKNDAGEKYLKCKTFNKCFLLKYKNKKEPVSIKHLKKTFSLFFFKIKLQIMRIPVNFIKIIFTF